MSEAEVASPPTSDDPAAIRGEMTRTRAAIAHKLDVLQSRLLGTPIPAPPAILEETPVVQKKGKPASSPAKKPTKAKPVAKSASSTVKAATATVKKAKTTAKKAAVGAASKTKAAVKVAASKTAKVAAPVKQAVAKKKPAAILKQ